MTLKQTIHASLSGTPAGRLGQLASVSLIVLILLNVAASIFDSVPSINEKYGLWLNRFEVFSVTVFLIEYILRVWSCNVEGRFAEPFKGRLRYMFTPLVIIDLLAVLPALLLLTGVDLRFLRIMRFSRIFRLAKLTRYSQAMKTMAQVFMNRREELVLAILFMMMVLIVSSSLMYFVEHERQPEVFASIPDSMWWGVMTLTTVGYGDVYPITIAGKILGGIISIVGIGLFALPAGIIGSAFVELKSGRDATHAVECPHCGKRIHD